MNRKIKFRGYSESQRRWIFGWLVENKEGDVFIRDCESYETFIVVAESVGQFAGIHDKTGRDVCEGDICRGNESVFGELDEGVILFVNGSFKIKYHHLTRGVAKSVGFATLAKKFEVIGNIYENPELLIK
jgi:uncharacterized phage protein (TIGR01671 family)